VNQGVELQESDERKLLETEGGGSGMSLSAIECVVLDTNQDKMRSAATNSESDPVFWRVWGCVYRDENPVMTFPIKRRINTKLFIDRMQKLYITIGGIRNENWSEGGGQPLVLVDPWIKYMALKNNM